MSATRRFYHLLEVGRMCSKVSACVGRIAEGVLSKSPRHAAPSAKIVKRKKGGGYYTNPGNAMCFDQGTFGCHPRTTGGGGGCISIPDGGGYTYCYKHQIESQRATQLRGGERVIAY